MRKGNHVRRGERGRLGDLKPMREMGWWGSVVLQPMIGRGTLLPLPVARTRAAAPAVNHTSRLWRLARHLLSLLSQRPGSGASIAHHLICHDVALCEKWRARHAAQPTLRGTHTSHVLYLCLVLPKLQTNLRVTRLLAHAAKFV